MKGAWPCRCPHQTSKGDCFLLPVFSLGSLLGIISSWCQFPQVNETLDKTAGFCSSRGLKLPQIQSVQEQFDQVCINFYQSSSPVRAAPSLPTEHIPFPHFRGTHPSRSTEGIPNPLSSLWIEKILNLLRVFPSLHFVSGCWEQGSTEHWELGNDRVTLSCHSSPESHPQGKTGKYFLPKPPGHPQIPLPSLISQSSKAFAGLGEDEAPLPPAKATRVSPIQFGE